MRLRTQLLVVFFLLIFGSTAGAETYTQIRLDKLTKAQYLQLYEMGLDLLESEGEVIEILAKQADLVRLQEAGFEYTVEIQDVVQHYKNRIGPDKTMGGFRTFSEIVTYLDSLRSVYPSIMSNKFSIGTTLQGRTIWCVKISDNHAVDETEPELLYISLIHAREPAAGASILHFMNHLLSNYGIDSEVTDLVNNREFYFVPVQNPDGYVHNETQNPGGGGLWRKNRRLNADSTFGVDLNRNYDFKWGLDNIGSSDQTSSETYRGTAPFSEPETDVVRDFTLTRNFVIVHNVHCYSNLLLWPPGHDRIFSTFDDFYVNLGDSMTQFNGYAPGIGWTLYPTNGAADDWHWGDTISKPRQISVTSEIGSATDGFWPSPSRIPTLVAENVFPNLFLARIADDPYVLAPPVPPVPSAPDSTGKNFTLNWSDTDTLNPGVTYRILEYQAKSVVSDNAEADNGYWSPVRMNLSTTRFHGGARSWKTSGANRAHHWLLGVTPREVQAGDSLAFWIWYDIETDWDYFYAQVSEDGGYTFANLPNSLTTNSNPNNLNLGNGITGASGNWVRSAYNLASYAGKQLIVRLSYFTDNAVLEEGVYLDDIEGVVLFGDTTEIAAAATGSSFNLTNKPNGTYWYRLSATDGENQTSRLSTLEKVLVSDYILGDVNGSGSITVSDLTFLINFLFNGGPAPNPLARANVNCVGLVTVADLTFLVNFLFNSGPAPNCP